VAAAVALVLALVFVFEGAVIGRSRSLPIGSHAMFLALVHLNVIGIGLLAWLLARNVVKLVIDRRRGIVGSKLNSKFVSLFVLTSALSTSGLFILCGFLVAHTVDTWFEIELSDGLRQALEIADRYYTGEERSLSGQARALAREIGEYGLLDPARRDALEPWMRNRRTAYRLRSIEVFDAQLAPLAKSAHVKDLTPDVDPAERALLAAGRSGQARTARLAIAEGDLLRGAAAVRADGTNGATLGVVLVERVLPAEIGVRVAAVRSALDSYRRLQPAAGPFRGSMLLLLGLLTLLSLLFSSWMGFRLAKQITDPIQRLAVAADEVAAGNLEVRVEHRGEDEIGLLVAGFNRMASDLQASRGDLERRRALMEVVLGGVGAGVISLDANGLVTTVNASAIRLLGIPAGSWVGAKLGEMLRGAPLEVVEHLLARIHVEGREILRQQVAISVDGEHRILNWTVSALRAGDATYAGAVALIDDVTQIVRGQRTAAWRDVARRIAHEVKNPLTPIQLSAQRLRRKLGPRIEDAESRQVLEQCTDAITAQVEAMKVLVSEFSKFATLPATDPTPTDLNALVSEAIAMYKGKPSIEFSARLAEDLPELDVDREQIKRVILNLVDNAMGAIEAAGPGPRAIAISTRIDRAVGTVQLEVADTGCGVRPEDRSRLFQPGFSTKQNGTGIGLSIVSRIVSDHSGHIRVRSHQPRGTRFVVELPARL
jgi:two-component system, NtrC family, nitrogen regulation sensor histidine kinase NtrY